MTLHSKYRFKKAWSKLRWRVSEAWHGTKLWFKRNIILSLIVLTALLTVAIVIILIIGNINSAERFRKQAEQAALDQTAALAKQETEFMATRDRLDDAMREQHDEHIRVVRYIRCIVLLNQRDNTTAEDLDSCLTGQLREDVLREQDFLAQ